MPLKEHCVAVEPLSSIAVHCSFCMGMISCFFCAFLRSEAPGDDLFVIVLNLGGKEQSLNINEHFDMGRQAEVITSSMQSVYYDGWVRGQVAWFHEPLFVDLVAVLLLLAVNTAIILIYVNVFLFTVLSLTPASMWLNHMSVWFWRNFDEFFALVGFRRIFEQQSYRSWF